MRKETKHGEIEKEARVGTVGKKKKECGKEG